MTAARPRLRRAARALAVAAALCGAAPASAGPKSDPGAAEALFQQARTLMDAGKSAEACPKFEDSYKLDPAPGTLLNIAECSRLAGKSATAWGQFIEAARDFRRKNDERRAQFADQRAAQLKPKLTYLVIRAASPPPGLVVKRDGAEQSSASFGERLPVDPGKHTFVAEAPGKRASSQTVEVLDGHDLTVEIPALEDAPPEPGPGEGGAGGAAPKVGFGDEGEGGGGRTQRVAGFVTLGVGLGGVAAGAVMVGLTAMKSGELDALCPDKHCSSQEGRDALDQATLFANLANGLLIAGGVTAGVGLVVVLTAPSDAPAPSVSLELAPRFVGLRGAF